LLRRFAGPAGAAGGGPLELLTRAMAHPEEELSALPAFLAEGAPLLVKAGGTGGGRAAYEWLELASAIRVLPRVRRADRWRWEEALARQMAPVLEGAKRMLVLRSAAAGVLWHYYLLMLARTRLKAQVPDVLLKGLWQKGFAGQAAGPLHPLTAETVVETFTYDELCALHAAYNAVVMPGGEELVEPVERVVKWHVENTQPDHGTQEPWGLAAFAALDDTGTFALQQVHDATTRLEGGADPRVVLALLADAVMTQEEAAG
jgi:hypothetical protein